MSRKHWTFGFTLIELSIVILVIGLIVGAVISANNIIEEFRLKSFSNKAFMLRTHAINFKDQYQELPGEFTKAFEFWGTNCNVDADRCNGNGDGYVLTGYGGSTDNWTESVMFHRHLYLAGYTQFNPDILGEDTRCYTDITVPAVNLSVARGLPTHLTPFRVRYLLPYDEGHMNTLHLTANANGDGRCDVQFRPLKPRELANIDNKYDDGAPAGGIIRSTFQGGNSCFSSTGYNIHRDQYRCDFKMILD